MPLRPDAPLTLAVALSAWLAALCGATPAANAQIIPQRRDGQGLARRDTSALDNAPQERGELPDTIVLRRYDPRFPVRRSLVPDSTLGLDYVRYDPVDAFGPDAVYANSITQPAAAYPILGTAYRRRVRLTQEMHPAYEPEQRPTSFFEQNVPFAYTSYDQGGEINDGQFRALFGRSFSGGWRLGARYRNTYQGGERNRYPESRGARIGFGVSLAHVPDSSRHRTYLWLDLGSYSFNTAGGYSFALADSVETPSEAFEADPLLVGLRTDAKRSSYHALHRVFLREQPDSTARGFAAAAELEFHKSNRRTALDGGGATPVSEELFGAFAVDERGVRVSLRETSLIGSAHVEYFTDPNADNPVGFNFRGGLYAGQQELRANYLTAERNVFLLGASGRVEGTVARQFVLDAEADLALGARAGEGRIAGALGWNYRERFAVAAEVLLERSRAPFNLENVGVNDVLIARPDLPVSTHTRLGGRIEYLPLGLRARGYLDLYVDAHVIGADGRPRLAAAEVAIPTLELTGRLGYGPLRTAHRGVLRATPQSRDARLPRYIGQHAVYADVPLFGGNLQLVTGLDGWVKVGGDPYTYLPFQQGFALGAVAARDEFQYAVDAFLAIKVQSFKAFVRFDNVLASEGRSLPETVYGYPVVRGETIGPLRGVLRFGVAFFLFN